MNYSPLRYPGGKAKFAPYVKQVMHMSEKPFHTYIEPFAGGAGVALDMLFSGEVERIVINDYDKAIYSFWRALLEETKGLIDFIRNTEVTMEEWHRQRYIYTTCTSRYSLELACAAFFLNRTNRSGILNAGPIGGYEQQGHYLIDARYNKDALIKRIEDIARRKKDILVYNKEVRPFIKQIIKKYGEDAFVYFDPPYFEKGNRLYKNSLTESDHKELAMYIRQSVPCEWIITYDNVEQIKNIYHDKFYQVYEWMYSIVKSNFKSEIVIFKHKELCPSYNGLSENQLKIKFI